jgi:hypothetical protein
VRFFKIQFLRKEASLYFRVLKNKYGVDYEEFLVLMIFVKIPRVMFNILNLNLLILDYIVSLLFSYNHQK